MTTRREVLRVLAGGVLISCAPAAGRRAPSRVAEAESPGSRLGVCAIDTSTGRELAHRADERFPLYSTFKWLLGAAVLAGVDAGSETLDATVAFGADDLLAYAPVTKKHVARGTMRVGALVEAAIAVSDNTAANLLLARLGGPKGLTAFLRSIGDTTTRLDRDEPSLNLYRPGDPRDTTTPRAMAHTMRRVLVGDVLSPRARGQLIRWLRASSTGRKRLRAGFPKGWRVGDKTGTGKTGGNDLAIAEAPGEAPILVASYLQGRHPLDAIHADVARVVAARFRPPERRRRPSARP